MKIAFLIHNAYGIGGAIRATANLAGALAARGHDVEITSVYRGTDSPRIPAGARVRLNPLIDIRKDSPKRLTDHELQQQPSPLLPEPESALHAFTRLADQHVERYLKETDADVVVGTRPGFLVYLSRFASGASYLRLGQEHLTFSSHPAPLRAAMDEAIANLDAYLTVTQQDAVTHTERLPRQPRVLRCLPNVVPEPATEPSDGTSRLIVAAGRLLEGKRFDLLIRSFDRLAGRHPDWSLRIYGRGPERARLRALIDQLALNERVFLMGPHSPLETEWAKAAIAVSASDAESFGLTLVEAMHCGVPVISTDCPIGPREIITDGTDGVLIPVDDEAALEAALDKLIDAPELRSAMGTAARITAQRYAPRLIAEQFEQVVRELRPELLPEAAPKAAAGTKARPTASATEGRAPKGSADPGARTLRRAAAALVRPLRRKPPVPAPAPKPAAAAPAAPLKALRPKASCRATADGGLALSFPRGGVTGEKLLLTARLRGTEGGEGERLIVPLQPPASGKGPLTARILRAAHQLAEGRWDFHVERDDDGKRARVAATLVEQARLLTLPLVANRDGVSAWVPYTTAAGSLTLRTWSRPAHAELDRVEAGEEHLTLTATLHGDASAPTHLVLTAPEAAEPVEIPVTATGDRRLRCTVPYASLLHAGEDTTWQLTVRTTSGTTPVPLGRLTGDNVDRKRTDVYPGSSLHDPAHGPVTVRPVFDPSNDLTIQLRAEPSPA